MKKKILFLLIPLILSGISGCVKYNGEPRQDKKSSSSPDSSEITPSSGDVTPSSDVTSSSSQNPSSSDITPEPGNDELPKGTEVKVYLVFGEYGLYQGNPVNSNIESLFLEHAIELDAKVGDLLPNDQVTSVVNGSHFVSWISYNNDGKLTEYLKVPGYENMILYASFSGGQGGGQGGSSGGGGEVVPIIPGEYKESTVGTLPTFGYGFKFSDGSYMDAVRTNDDNGFSQYLINHRIFKKDQVFQLYDFENNAGWTVDIDPYSFGGNSSESTNWKTYISHNYSDHTYKVLKDFNAESIYIKLKYGEDQIYFQLGE